ncbi:MAG: UDP-N-acetylmuramoyl-L-alanine--D-glutamate ligase [Parcubacteria group bacterium]|nr:UDP-N-acetylmuramoyl-L-alanine--D-glutamate ligase [Parcubacteria group bacterium]MCR4342945.1 UDP-N-acetylmuramoyl-L-alanine--D-glutamate ligase [Patescibacteria group bacterium]
MENKFKNKRVVVMGLGGYGDGSGISAALFFARVGARVLVTDLKKEEDLRHQIKKLNKFKNIQYFFGGHREKDFQRADLIFQNPSVPDSSVYLKIARENNIPIINDWSLFLDNNDNFLIGVTGSKGKSTTTSLVYEFIKKKNKAILCGNIGVSPLKYMDKIKKEDVVVAEFSSWLLRGLLPAKKSPNIAVITNLKSDHLDKYKSLEDYHNDKKIIFKFQGPQDFLILNKDDKESKKAGKGIKSRIFWFSKKHFNGKDGIFIEGRDIVFKVDGKEEKVVKISDIQVPGDHNLENVLAGVCAAKIFGVKNSDIRMVLRDFKGVKDRLELVREIKGIKYYNDTTATNPDGAVSALKAFKEKKKRIILIAGGVDKNLDYKEFAKTIKKEVKELIIFPGTATDKLLKEINVHHSVVHKMKEAVRLARSLSKKGDIVLLSPGAASFGLFKNEFDRGKQFVREVRKLK